MPTAWVEVRIQDLVLPIVSILDVLPPGLWHGGRYYFDGAGGIDNKRPMFRRCGCGLTLFDAEANFQLGVLVPLVGSPRAAPRSELFAIAVLFRFLEPHASAQVYTDSEICAKSLRSHRLSGGNSILLSELLRLGAQKQFELTVTWVKAHSIEAASVHRSVRIAAF